MVSFKEFLQESEIEINQHIAVIGIPNRRDIPEIKKLMTDYDWHTWAIDDNAQMKKANENNKVITDKLKKLGIQKLVHNRFHTSLNPTPRRVELKI